MDQGGAAVMIDPALPLSFLGQFGDAIHYIIHGQEAETGGVHVGGISNIVDLALTQMKLTGLAMAFSFLIAFPVGVLLGHYGRGELIAVGVGNVGRAVPELVVIAIMAAAIGVGTKNLVIALAILAVPPMLVGNYVAIRNVDRATVDAARGMGMTTLEQIWKVELPLGIPSIMYGIRISFVTAWATATIAPLAGVLTLGDPIVSRGANGIPGLIGAGICVAVLALTGELLLAGVQRLITPAGVQGGGDVRFTTSTE
jgi:osmoprotectant transport system permease protein